MKTSSPIRFALLAAAASLVLCTDSAQAQGGVPLWTNRYDGPMDSYDQPSAVAVDSKGNVFVTGYSTADSSGNEDYATIKYSNAGVPLWTNRYDGLANDVDYSTAIAVDTTGNVFVTGLSWNGIDHDYVTLAYSNSGVPLWTNLNTGLGDDYEPAIAVDNSGNVSLTGSSSRNATSPYNFDFV